ncbi:unnamed protein product [Symbiodinium sp. CCMP2592]|nr:unnamed protein product [Symbiodinium sp. CCMP2592]
MQSEAEPSDAEDGLPLTFFWKGVDGRSSGQLGDNALPGDLLEDASQAAGVASGEHLEINSVDGAFSANLDVFEEDVWSCGNSAAERDWYKVDLSEDGAALPSEVSEGLPTEAHGLGLSSAAAGSSAASARNLDRSMAAAFQTLDVPQVKQVWENDFWGSIFTPQSEDSFRGFYGTGLKRPLQPGVPEGVLEQPSKNPQRAGRVVTRIFEMAVVNRVVASWKQQREEQLLEAVGAWAVFIGRWSEGVQVRDQLCELPTDDERKAMTYDVLGAKAPGTLRKRLRSLLKYEAFLRQKKLVFPANEILLYMFLCLERDGGASLSSRKATYEAVVFCRYVLGVEELDLCVKSRRCLGNACRGEVRPRNRASPLTVDELSLLHDRLENAQDPWDRVFAGAVLLCVYSRSRWSDLMHAEGIIYDYDNQKNLAYVECPVAYHRNMRSRVMRHDLLPMVAPGLGVAGSNWARLWKLAREELNIPDPPEFPVMPAPDKSGAASVRPLDTEEMGRWLRHLLTGSGSKQADRKLSSHSCKCTMLSYAAKRGISIVDRQLLGYHTTPHRMALTYSRDSAAHPLMILERMIKEIRDRVFLPDETRSGRLVGKAADSQQRSEVVVIKDEHDPPSPIEGDDAAHNLAGDEEALDAEATGHITTDSSSSDSCPEEAEGPFSKLVVNVPEGHDVWRHEKSRVVHFVPNMSTVIESEAAFKQRCAEASKDATLHTKLEAQGIRCFKTLAFAIGSPQQPPTEAQFDEFSVKVYGAAPTMGQTAILRHLHFEATTLVVQTYRDMVTNDPSDPSHTRKVPVPEKRARLEFQRRRLSGMEISGELEPSHQLLDIANQQYESGVLTWIPASKCAKREAEVLALGKDRSSLLQVEQNVIKVGPGDQAIACDVSDPLRFQWAMMRRGIAFDNCHLLSWDVHQRWIQKMLDCLSATPPPSYSPVSLNQCMRADKELFLLLAREAVPPFKVDSLGVSPLDAKFSAMMYDVRLQQFLLPLPKQTAPVLAVPVDDGDCTFGAAAAGEQTRPLVYRALEQVRGLHRDENNRDGPTLLVPLTDFENGELWFQKVGGDVASLNDPSLEGRGKVAELSCLLIRCVSARSSGLNYELPSQRDASSVQPSAAGMYFVELCAGRAGEQVVIMDLSDPAQAEAVVDFLRVEYHHVICVFISPPVGTASFMRERHKPGSAELDLKMPHALRSALHPDGLPTLRGRDKLQVERANQLFDQLASIACEACDLGILTVLESPSNSRYWDTSFCAKVTNHVQGHFVKFHACVHGGHRPKLMQLWSSQDVFGMLAGRCDGSHEHKPWRPFISKRKRVSFITADEPEFPPLLVDRILGCIVHAHPSLSFGPRVLAQAIQDPSANVARINLGTQPRGNSLPSLVWEFDTTLDFVVPVQNDKPLEAVLFSLPKGSRIFSRRVCEWGSLKSLLEGVGKPKTNILGLDPLRPPACAELVQVGVPCSEDVFVERAIAAGHPRSLAVHVEPFVTVSARANFEAPPAELAAFRIDAMKFWIGRAGALKEKEQELHQNLPDHLRPILKGKKLLLLQEMMRAAGCEDVDLVSDICQGFKLSGWLPASGEFVPRSRRPKFSVETLGVLSKGLNKATLQKLSRRQDSEIEESTWVETQKEIDAGWVWLEEGPVPEMVSIAMRFGIMQNKLRVIDDLSCCGLNATVGLLEKFCLHTIDKLAAMMAHAFDVVSGVMPECCGRTFDLTAAYKQFGVCAADRERLRIAVNRPGHHKPSFLGVNALPFGGVGSVAAFLRISIALWKIGIVLFRLFWSAFFDDYSIVSAKSLESNAQWTVETLFDLLGFRFAKDGSKAEPFGVTFNMLGLSVDLSCVKQRILRVGHTQKRKEELTEYIQTILRLPNNLTEDLMWALTWLRERIALSQPLVVERNLITTLIVFTDGACNPEEGTGGVGGVLVNASGTPCEFFGEAVPSDVMQQLLSISANPIFELELIPALISLIIWAERLKGAQVVFYLDNDGARHSLIRTFGGSSIANSVIESFLQLETTLQLKTWFARVPTACNIADNPSRLEFEPLLKRGAARRAIPWDQVMP